MTAETFKKIQDILAMTNAEIAAELGISVSAVEKWRTGERNISPGMAIAIERMHREMIVKRNWGKYGKPA